MTQPSESFKRRWSGQLPPLEYDEEFGSIDITCDDCAQVRCAVCGHEPCPFCLDCCDNSECLVAGELPRSLIKNHDCQVLPCE